jgi:uncharacterized membrane protein
MRAVPDVSLTAAGHDGYMVNLNGSYYIIAGTSAAAPSFAGIMALLVQSKGGSGQGNANTGLYPLVNAARNPFHATPSGNNTVPGATGYTATGSAYNLATGLGSVDGAVLVSSWGLGSSTATIDFALAPSTVAGSAQAGKSTSFTMAVTETGSGKSAVTLTASSPSGITVSFAPATITPGSASTVTISASPTVAAGEEEITLTGTDSTGTHAVTYALTVTAPPSVALSLASASASVSQGASTTVGLTATTNASFSGALSYSVSGLPAGVTAKWSLNPTGTLNGVTTNSQTLTLAATSTATLGSASVAVTVASGSVNATVNLSLLVQLPPSVQLSSSPTSVVMQSLGSATVTVTAVPVGGVTLPAAAAGSSLAVASGLPSGFTAIWSAPTLNSSGATVWTLTLTGSASAKAGSATLLLSGTVVASNGKSYAVSENLPLTVTLSPATLALALGATTVSVSTGSKATEQITLTGNVIYSGNVTLSLSTLPNGVTGSFSSNPVTLSNETGTVTLTLTAAATAASASQTITVTAKGDGLTCTQQFSLQVLAPPAVQLSASPASLSMQSLATVTATVTATPAGGVVLTSGATGSSIKIASGLPKGISTSWSAPELNGAGNLVWTLTLTGSASALAGSATLGLTAQVAGSGNNLYAVSMNLPLTVTLTPATLTATPGSSTLTLTQGASVNDTVALAGNGTFSGPITLSVTGLATGVTATWSANPVTLTNGASAPTLTLTATAAAATGSSSLTVIAKGDNLTVSKPISLQVVTPPGVQFTSSASAVSVQSLSSTVVTLTATPVGGITLTTGATKSAAKQADLTLAAGTGPPGRISRPIAAANPAAIISLVSGLPSGFTSSFSAPSMTATGAMQWTLTLTGSSSAKAGSSTLAIAVIVPSTTGGLYTASLNLSIAVTLPPATLSLTPAASTASCTQGFTVTDLINLTANNSFTGTVSLSVTGLPTGVSTSWTTNPATLLSGTGSTTLSLTAAPSAAAGSYPLTLTAKGDNLTVSKTIMLEIQPVPSLQVTLSSTALSMTHSATGTITTTTTAVGGENSQVSFTVSGLPTGITGSFSKPTLAAPGAGTTTLTLTGSSHATAGSAQITVTATTSSGQKYPTAVALTLR